MIGRFQGTSLNKKNENPLDTILTRLSMYRQGYTDKLRTDTESKLIESRSIKDVGFNRGIDLAIEVIKQVQVEEDIKQQLKELYEANAHE